MYFECVVLGYTIIELEYSNRFRVEYCNSPGHISFGPVICVNDVHRCVTQSL